MDRAVVYSEEEKQDSKIELMFNIPFELVERPYIEQMKDRTYSYEDYLQQSKAMNNLPNIWNIAAIERESGILMMFVWGYVDMLEKIMHITRVTAHPRTFGMRNINAWMFDIIKEFGQRLGMERIIFITQHYRAWLKKLNGEAYLNKDARIMEFY